MLKDIPIKTTSRNTQDQQQLVDCAADLGRAEKENTALKVELLERRRADVSLLEDGLRLCFANEALQSEIAELQMAAESTPKVPAEIKVKRTGS